MKAQHESKTKPEGDWPKVETEGNVRVKIYRRMRSNGTEGFEVPDYSTGKRVLRSYPTFEKARAGAKKIAKLLASGEVEAARMRNSDAASFGRAMELLRPTGISLELACAHFVEAWKILGCVDKVVVAAQYFKDHAADKVTPKTVADVVIELLLNKSKRAGKTTSDLRSRCTRFAEDFKVDIGTISTVDVQRWLDGLKDTDCRREIGEQTRLNYRTKINQLFRFAERRGYIAKHSNPVEGTETPDVPESEIQIYTSTEIERLLNAAEKNFQVYLALGAFAGLRSSEIQRLTWDKIDFHRGLMEATGRKRGTPSRRFVPITDNLREWIAPHAKKSGYVWQPNIADRDKESENAATVAQRQTVKATAGAEIKPVEWKHNALRHSFISYRLAEIKNVNQVALEAGNSTQMIFRHYRELVTPEAAEKWFAVVPQAAQEPNKVISLETAAARAAGH